jgi:hypothetical protein
MRSVPLILVAPGRSSYRCCLRYRGEHCAQLGVDPPCEAISLAHVPGLPHHVAVIIWLNGPFGIGKSTTAQALRRRLPQAVLFDPEPFGAALRSTVVNIETGRGFPGPASMAGSGD